MVMRSTVNARQLKVKIRNAGRDLKCDILRVMAV